MGRQFTRLSNAIATTPLTTDGAAPSTTNGQPIVRGKVNILEYEVALTNGLSGAPTQAGSFRLRVTVRDSGATITKVGTPTTSDFVGDLAYTGWTGEVTLDSTNGLIYPSIVAASGTATQVTAECTYFGAF